MGAQWYGSTEAQRIEIALPFDLTANRVEDKHFFYVFLLCDLFKII